VREDGRPDGGRKGYITERNGRSSWERQGIVTFCTRQWNEQINEWIFYDTLINSDWKVPFFRMRIQAIWDLMLCQPSASQCFERCHIPEDPNPQHHCAELKSPKFYDNNVLEKAWKEAVISSLKAVNKTMKNFMQNVVYRIHSGQKVNVPLLPFISIYHLLSYFRSKAAMCIVTFETHPHATPYYLWHAPEYLWQNSGAGLIQSSVQLVIFAIVMCSHLPLDNAPWRVVWCDKDYMVAWIKATEMWDIGEPQLIQCPGKRLFKVTCNEHKPVLHPYIVHESSFCLWAVLTTTLAYL
jgi:hypothetical protein